MHKHIGLPSLGVLALAIAAPIPALAQEQVAETETAAVVMEADTDAATPAFAEAAAVDESELATIAGREDVYQLNQSDQQNAVEGNSVGDDTRTGTVRIDDNAFQNMNGLSILNANTGNNVAINASIQVNISMPEGAQ